MWGYRLNDKNSGVWRRTKTLPCNVHMFWSKRAAFDMEDWIKHAVKNVIHSLVQTGFLSQLLEEIEEKVSRRICKVIGIEHQFNASKALSKSIWIMVDKSIFTKYARASHCSIAYNSVRQAMFEDYLDFSKEFISLMVWIMAGCGLWLDASDASIKQDDLLYQESLKSCLRNSVFPVTSAMDISGIYGIPACHWFML